MFKEPVRREAGGFFQRAAFFKVMGRATNDGERLFPGEHVVGFLVHFERGLVLFAHDEQRRGFDTAKRVAGEVGASTTRDHCADGFAEVRCGDECGAGTGVRAEETEAQIPRLIFIGDPVGGAAEALREEPHVEAQVCALGFVGAFVGREQFDQELAETGLAEEPGQFAIAQAPTAAGVGEDDQPVGVEWNGKFALKRGGTRGEADVAGGFSRLQSVSFSAHSLQFFP